MNGFDERVLATARNLGDQLGLAVVASFTKPIRVEDLRGAMIA